MTVAERAPAWAIAARKNLPRATTFRVADEAEAQAGIAALLQAGLRATANTWHGNWSVTVCGSAEQRREPV